MADEPLLSGLVVVDMSQFLSGPYCSLRLSDLGARVIKIERPDGGDLSRRLYLTDTEIGGDSTLFHAINRGKESLAIDLKNEADLAALHKLIAKADVLIQNFRPGVTKRLGLDYEAASAINPRLVYASITGYGDEGPWVKRPGQDLLAQARSGVMWLNGDEGQGPVPFGLAIGDMFAGAAPLQGILAALVRRGITGKGGHIETSLLEALVDFQFEVLTTFLNDGRRLPTRSNFRSAHAYLSAPYGVYHAKDGFIAIAMTPIPKLAGLLGLEAELAPYADEPKSWFTARDDIKAIVAEKIATGPSTSGWPSSSRLTSGVPRCSTGTSSRRAKAFGPSTCCRPSSARTTSRSSPPGRRSASMVSATGPRAPRRAVGEHSAADPCRVRVVSGIDASRA